MPIKFKCKYCGEVLKVSRKDAGKLGKCKQCRRPVRAPIPTALPAEQPAHKYVSQQRSKAGLLSELKAHPLWCVVGAFAFIVLVGAVILLNFSNRTGRPNAGSSDTTKREQSEAGESSKPGTSPEEGGEIAGDRSPESSDKVLPENLTNEELEAIPVWAQIILDHELFPNGDTWKVAESVFETQCKYTPSLRSNRQKKYVPPSILSNHTPALTVALLSAKYGRPYIIAEEDVYWYCYGLIEFGLKKEDDPEKDPFSQIQAPVYLFTNGFTRTAKNSAFSQTTSTKTSKGRVLVVNSYSELVILMVAGYGPYFLQPDDKRILPPLPIETHRVDMKLENDVSISIPAIAFDGALWRIMGKLQDHRSIHLFLEADQNPSIPSDDSPEVNMTLVNKYTSVLSIRVGYDGRYYRLKPDQEQMLHLREKKYVVYIESDDGRSAYQIAQASENITWDINATSDETNFYIDVNDSPVIHEQLPQEDIPAQTIARSFDPNQPVGQVQVFEGHIDAVSNVTFSPDGSKVLSCGGGKDKTIRLWDISDETELQCFEASQQSATKPAFSSNGRFVWSYNSTDYSACYFDLQTGEELGGFKQHICTSHTVAFSRSAQHILIADKALFIWELETGELSRSIETQQDSNSTEQIKEIALSPDEQYVLIGFDSGNLQLWYMDEETSKEILIHQLRGHKAWINSLDFSPDGQLAVSGGGYCKWQNSPEKSLKRGLGSVSEDCTVRVWDLDSGQQITCFDGHQEPVTTVAFSPDGQRILSGGYDNTVSLWDIGSSKEVICFSGHTGPVNSVAFSPDGRLAVSASNDRTVRMWKLPESIEVAKEVVEEDIIESEDDKVSEETQEPVTSKQPESTNRQLLNIRSSEITQIAPALQVTGPGFANWPIYNYAHPIIEADDEDFLWVMIDVRQRIVKKDVPGLSIKDVNGNEVGSQYACIDGSTYIRSGIPVISFAGGAKIPIERLPDRKARNLLYTLACGKWTSKNMLLIFKGEYRSVEDLYLDGPNVHILLHLDQRSSPVRSPNIRGSRQNMDRNNIQNPRERNRRTSLRERTR